ncbi:bifunctional 4-hydroxy-2-oxoglutarate aldolase/2-dehydro-3-deoxy-phosphogluconate aldolase [Legionella oakridgensis]|uniref:2-keto-3-deoxy-6-phosphogluconate aldolase n=2 Tax=Legionella oakridgensis TaxID=29423 RepID=W0BA41_9GAMM|nr:bifunctional 4-hydroxy-2-oxoglutarate aldolase/2-dehydro-3-deoxy-phosphogluconate aldolase [Legionella oakridgensis]AHE66725.1 2-keto-3-deoxy-6-phosphogluconate aldolase [Legionella oakridgensis ATCC 33761 = DSM 21215]ETO93592.1 2-keto-3-deoxy-phosphogluconate aldolase [Legionella oakridgensis RV-2-2007]KTD38097.1 keto-hydroxyglutarate aldolase [Legionella oakridgensis]STY19857.1 keto-hydroxyglutarate aldolase [Legionella longbeachae]
MMIDKLVGNQSIIITLDVDGLLYDKLRHIAEAGFSVVEINSVDPALLTKVLHDFPSLRIGAGNVIDTQQLENCHQAGVDFVTSPGFMPAIAQTANIYSINYLPGVATLSEAMHAMSLGCHHVRPYPANLTFCTLLNKCLPLLRLFPAEIEWEEAEHFFNLPAVAAVSILNPESKQLPALETV